MTDDCGDNTDETSGCEGYTQCDFETGFCTGDDLSYVRSYCQLLLTITFLEKK